MVGFPETPVMLKPFCGNGTASDIANDFPQTGSDSEISYAKGIPLPFSIPTEGGGVRFTRQQMNRLGYTSTVGTYKSQFGWHETFNDTIGSNGSGQGGGYPKGARLMYYKLAPKISTDAQLPSGTKYTGVINAYSTTSTYSVGTIVYNDSTSSSDASKLWACKTAISTPEQWDGSKWMEVVIIDCIEVISMKDENTYDFRVEGPKWLSDSNPGNYWAQADLRTATFFPKYSDLQVAENLLVNKTTSGSYKSDTLVINQNGWLVLNVERTLDSSSFTTVGELLTSYADGVTISVTNAQSTNPIFNYSYQFGASNTIAQTIPVGAGYRVTLTTTNNRGDSTVVKLYKIGTAA